MKFLIKDESVFVHLVTSRNLNCTDKIAAVKRIKEFTIM